MRPRGGRQQARPSLYADDHLGPGERDYYGDDEGLDIAEERYHEARVRYVAPEPDVVDERPEVDDDRADDAAREVMDWRAALLDGRPLAWRTKGATR